MNQNPNQTRRINERMRRRRRRRAALVIFILAAILVALAGIYVGLLISGRDKPPVDADNDTTTAAPVETTDAPAETTAAPAVEETTAAPVETTAPPLTYTTFDVKREAIARGNLVLVSANYPYTFPADEKHLTLLYGNKSKGYQLGSAQDKLETEALTAWNKAADAFLAETGNGSLLVTLNGGYRSKEAQQDILDRRIARDGEVEAKKYVALPGNSEHHTGLAMDLSVFVDGRVYTLDSDPVYSWIPKNLPSYGFVLRYPDDKVATTGINYEDWHFRYVGVPHAIYMTENNLCLEEYLNALRAYQADGQHLLVNTDISSYEIWFVPAADGETTPISVPNGVAYSISGNNIDGFIVTLTRPAE